LLRTSEAAQPAARKGRKQLFGSGASEFLDRQRALLVGFVAPDGSPHAARGWGLELQDATAGVVRLLVAARDVDAAGAAPGARLAVTATDVLSLRSLQLKGAVVDIGPTRPGDDDLHRRYCDRMFADIEATDGTPRRVLARLVPTGLVSCTVRVDQVYDQTPGPGAGAAVGTERDA
jgi:hypothetical protein